MYCVGLDSAIVGHDSRQKVYASHTKNMQSVQKYLQEAFLLAKQGLQKKGLTQSQLSGEVEAANAAIPQVLTFILLSAGLRLYGETCVVGSERTHEDEGSTSWI